MEILITNMMTSIGVFFILDTNMLVSARVGGSRAMHWGSISTPDPNAKGVRVVVEYIGLKK